MSDRWRGMEAGADLSDCGRYRYRLWRWWDTSKPFVNFIMLNPSTADARVDDPTIRKCVGFAKCWAYGGIMVTNLFAFRATKPEELKKVDDPVGRDNDVWVREEALACERVVVAWGTKGTHLGRNQEVIGLLSACEVKPWHLGTSKDGHPFHPLYQPYGRALMPFRRVAGR